MRSVDNFILFFAWVLLLGTLGAFVPALVWWRLQPADLFLPAFIAAFALVTAWRTSPRKV